MSDLISRSELLKAMDTWDKFGYDEHNRLIKIDRTNKEYVPYVHYEDMVKCVNDIPTAYDIDKVVEELEELAESHRQAGFDVEKNGFSNVADKMYGKQCAFIQAIEIVKQGGVTDDVCEWRIVDRPNGFPIYNTSCEKIRFQYATGIDVYCNGCGKKIKVIGD